MVVASKYLVSRWRALQGTPVFAMVSHFSSRSQHYQQLNDQEQQAPPLRVLRSLGKQSSLFSHYYAGAIAIRRLIEERRWDVKLEKALQSLAIPLSDGLVVEVIKSLSEAKLALRFFVWMSEQKEHQHLCFSSTAISVLSRRWCHEKLFGTFLRVLHLPPSSMTSHSFRILLLGYGWAGMLDKVVETLEAMPSLGFHPTSSHFLCVLNILDHESFYSALPRVRKGMQQAGFFPDAEMYKKLIRGLCIAGQKEEAYSLFQEMKVQGLSPGVEVYRILISFFSKASQVPEVLMIFNELLDDEIKPDAKACNALIKALCSYGKLEEALEVLEMMLTKALNPNLVSLTMVVDGLFKFGDVSKVFGLWEILCDYSIPTVTFQDRLVIELCNAGKLAEVETIFAVLKKRNMTASTVAYKTFIIALCRMKNIERAGDCLAEMADKLGKSDVGICNSVLEELGTIDVEIQNALLEKLGKKSDANVCNVMLNNAF